MLTKILYARDENERDAQSKETTTALLERIQAATERAGARLLLVLLPGESEDGRGERVEVAYFNDFCAGRGVQGVDPSAAFRRAFDALGHEAFHERYFLPGNPHYSRAGYDLIAAELAAALEQTGAKLR